MTITQAIERTDSLVPNTYLHPDKLRWLTVLDGRIQREIIDRYEGEKTAALPEYDEDTVDSTLLVPAPYDELYVHWLSAMIHYANGEMARYNNSLARFDAEYIAFARQYATDHMPRAGGRRFSF